MTSRIFCQPSRVSTIGSPAASGGEAGKAPKTAAEQEQAFRQRRAEAEEKAKKDEKVAQETKAKDAYCASARRELASLQSGQRIVRTDDKGERVFLEDAQIQQEIARVQRVSLGATQLGFREVMRLERGDQRDRVTRLVQGDGEANPVVTRRLQDDERRGAS